MNTWQILRTWIRSAVDGIIEGGRGFAVGATSSVFGVSRRKLLYEYKELVYACISVIAQEIGDTQFKIGRRRNDGEIRYDPNHPMLQLLAEPNPRYDNGNEMFDLAASILKLTGEVFLVWQLSDNLKQPVRITVVNGDRVEIATQQSIDPNGIYQLGDIVGYIITNDDGVRIPVGVNEVSHIKSTNPINNYRGYGETEAGLTSIHIDSETSDFQLAFIENNATPSSIITAKGHAGQVVSEDEFNKMNTMFNSRNSGARNAGKSMFLREMDIDVKKLGMALDELDMKSLKDLSADRLRGMYRVPKPLLGWSDGAGLGRAGVETEEYIFQKYTIKNCRQKFVAAIQTKCNQYWPNDPVIVSAENTIPEDKEFILKQQETFLDNVWSRDDIRQQLGQEPVPGGSKRFIPFNYIEVTGDTTVSRGTPKGIKMLKRTTEVVKTGEQVLFDRLETLENQYAPQIHKHLAEGIARQHEAVNDYLDLLSGEKKVPVTTQNEILSVLKSVNLVDLILNFLLGAAKDGADLALLLSGEPDPDWVLTQSVRDEIFNSTERLIVRFNDRTAFDVQQKLSQLLADGADPNEVRRQLEELFKGKEGWEAERIARTETQYNLNQGMAQGYLEAGYTEIEWLCEEGACEFCREQQGVVKAIGSFFFLRGDEMEGADGGHMDNTWRDLSHPPLHANCRCTIRGVEKTKTFSAKSIESIEIHLPSDDELAKALNKMQIAREVGEEINKTLRDLGQPEIGEE